MAQNMRVEIFKMPTTIPIMTRYSQSIMKRNAQRAKLIICNVMGWPLYIGITAITQSIE